MMCVFSQCLNIEYNQNANNNFKAKSEENNKETQLNYGGEYNETTIW